jgi:putative pyruvate formate lyase activating enzyme
LDGYFHEALSHCTLCPHECGADRRAGRKGFCLAGDRLQIYRYGGHHGEEPPISGSEGSGTVFFSRCTLRCIYCQNYPWSQEGEGNICEVDDLVAIFRDLKQASCHNINLVSPTPWLPMIVEAVNSVRALGVHLPVVYNTSGYERAETLCRIEDLVDVYLTDLRYADSRSALEGSGAADYTAAARAAIREMWRQKGSLVVDSEGTARKGVIVRILVLPGREDEACASLEWLADEFGPQVPVSVMSQYTPAYKARGMPGWTEPVSRKEYDRVVELFETLGFEHGWMQDPGNTPEELLGFNMKQEYEKETSQ